MFKKVLVAVIAMVMMTVGVLADTATVNGITWTYTVSGGEASIFNDWDSAIPSTTTGAITIPSSLGGYPVTKIGGYAFYGCWNLTSVTIPDSVTSIGGDAFSNCSGLTSVTIGNSVTSIGSHAFYDCSGLTSVTIPNSVTSIGGYAFNGCSGLTSITIPNSVTSIGDGAFSGCSDSLFDTTSRRGLKLVDGWVVGYTDECPSVLDLTGVRGIMGGAFSGCSGLTSVTIPDSVTSIGEYAFEGCSGLTQFIVDSNNTSYKSVNGLLLSKDGKTLITGVNGDVVIPQGVTSIGDYAFDECSGLTSVTIPNSVTSIGRSAFSGCSGLTSITIPDSVTSIGYYAFSGCNGLTKFIVDSNNTSYKSVNGLLLSKDGKTLITGVNGDVVIPQGVTSIGNYAFDECSGLTSVTIPDSVTSIGEYAFSACSGLTRFIVDSNNPSYKSVNGLLLSKDGKTLIAGINGNAVIPDSVTSIGEYAFNYYRGLTSVTIPDSVTSIGEGAFYECYGLTSVTIPNSVTSIGEGAFWNCDNIKTVTVGQYICSNGLDVFPSYQSITNVVILDSVTSIGNGAFDGCRGLMSITIPNSVTSIGGGAFHGCSGLTSVTIGNSVTSIGDSAFRCCDNIKTVTVGQYICSNGLYYIFPSYQSITNVVILDSVTSIGGGAFWNCSGLTSVTIPDSVTSIGNSAFKDCDGLTKFIVDSNNPSYKSVNGLLLSKDGKTLIAGVNGDVTIPDSVTSIGWGAFSGCSGLASVTIPDSITSIGNGAFDGCSGLTEFIVDSNNPSYKSVNGLLLSKDGKTLIAGVKGNITIPDGVMTIGDWAFLDNGGLTSVTIPDSVTTIGAGAFEGCNNLTKVSIGNGVSSIGWGAFEYCSGLTQFIVGSNNPSYKSVNGLLLSKDGKTLIAGVNGDVVIPNSVTSIGVGAFYNCSGLTSVTIGNNVTSIGEGAFWNCRGLTSVMIPNSVTSIGDWAFEGCSILKSAIFLGDAPRDVGDMVFNYCADDFTIKVKKGTKGWNGDYTSTELPETWLGYPIEIFYDEVIDGIRWYFSINNDNAAIIKVYVSDNAVVPMSIGGYSVTSIGEGAFSGCSGLTSVTIPDSVTSIGYGAFSDCSGSLFDTTTIQGLKLVDGWVTGYTTYNISNLNLSQARGIVDGALDGCTSIKTVTMFGNQYALKDILPNSYQSVESVDIIGGDYSINGDIFDGCTSLKSVTIGAGVSISDNSLFSDCSNMDYVVLPESFVGKLDFEGIQEVHSDYKCVVGGDAIWVNDNEVTSDENGSLRSGKISNNQSTYLEMFVEGTGRLSYKWKASSEYYDEDIFDYGYLSLDGRNLSSYDSDNYRLSGIGIGGDTDWQYVELDVSTSGSHIFRWTYCKDEIDESNVGEDCIWVDEIKYQPMNAIIFDIGGGMGTAPAPINALSESNVALPSDSGFAREDFVFAGWSDGIKTYQAGETYVMPLTNITMTAQWIAKKFLTFNLGDGEGASPSVIKEMPGTTVMLPNSEGFSRKNYSFAGWSDGVKTYSAGESFVVGDSDITFTALWSANTLNAPTIMSDEVVNGGVLTSASSVISITAEDDTEIYYTTDGTTPSASSAKYDKPFVVDALGENTIKAIAVRDNYFDSDASIFTFTRIPYSVDECLNAEGLTLTTGGATNWYRVVGDEAYDGVAALRSGAINDSESTFVKATVFGEGTISFWWKSSSEISRNRKYDYVSFTIDGVEQSWLGGDTDWTNIVCRITTEGEHTLVWTYQKNASSKMFEDCAWLDEVSWIPSSQVEAIPELPSSATADVVAYALAASTDANLVKNITNIEMYSAYREWALSVKNASGDEVAGVEAVKASSNAWISFALDSDVLIAKAPVDGDVVIDSFEKDSSSGLFEFTVNIKDIGVGNDAIEENLRKVFDIEGSSSLLTEFSADLVDISVISPENGKVKFSVAPIDKSKRSFFFRVKMK